MLEVQFSYLCSSSGAAPVTHHIHDPKRNFHFENKTVSREALRWLDGCVCCSYSLALACFTVFLSFLQLIMWQQQTWCIVFLHINTKPVLSSSLPHNPLLYLYSPLLCVPDFYKTYFTSSSLNFTLLSYCAIFKITFPINSTFYRKSIKGIALETGGSLDVPLAAVVLVYFLKWFSFIWRKNTFAWTHYIQVILDNVHR